MSYTFYRTSRCTPFCCRVLLPLFSGMCTNSYIHSLRCSACYPSQICKRREQFAAVEKDFIRNSSAQKKNETRNRCCRIYDILKAPFHVCLRLPSTKWLLRRLLFTNSNAVMIKVSVVKIPLGFFCAMFFHFLC